MADLTDDLADGPLASDGSTIAAITSYADAWTFTETYLPVLIPGGVAVDAMSVTESFVLSLTRNAVMSEHVALSGLLRVLQAASIRDNAELTGNFVAWVNALLRAGVRLADAFTTSFKFNLTMSQALTLAQSFDVYNGISFTETFTLTSQPTYAFTANSQIVEALSLAVDLTENLVMRLALTEVVDVDDATLLKFIYSGVITEDIVMELLYQSPGGSITTWAINTRTNAVTEYRNFAFNSFASIGRKYLAADRSGLYELNGDKDNGSPILAAMGGGYFQPNGSKFAGLKGVYLGMAGPGAYLLKIITGDGIERVYRSNLNPGLMTTKVNMGKGIKARYFGWELINEGGQDFDFDQIEFVPMMSGRRV
jgi:hypothetical protein